MKIFDRGFDALEADMNFRLQRQNLISSNLANQNTPGFQAKDLKFDDALKEIYASESAASPSATMTETNKMHMQGEPGELPPMADGVSYVTEAPGIDENGVDLDREMARMAENSIMYSASSVALKKQFGMLKYAVQDSGK